MFIPGASDRLFLDGKNAEGSLPDSGKRREFPTTGSVRDSRNGKGRFDLISPIAMMSLAKRLEDGMDKYGERNWEKGQPLMSYIDSTLRHISQFIVDIMMGKKSEEDHMSAALWNLHSFVHTEVMIREGLLPEELNDLPTPNYVKGASKLSFDEIEAACYADEFIEPGPYSPTPNLREGKSSNRTPSPLPDPWFNRNVKKEDTDVKKAKQ